MAKLGPSPFVNLLEKMNLARRCLMAPHLASEDQAFADSFHACWLGLDNFDENLVAEYGDAQEWIRTIKRIIDTTGFGDPTSGGYLARVQAMTYEEKRDFSNAVDELANWFRREDWAYEDPGG